MPCASGTVLTQPDWKTSMFFSLLNPTSILLYGMRVRESELLAIPSCRALDSPETGNSRVSLASSRLNRSIYRYGLGHVVWHPPPSAKTSRSRLQDNQSK